MKYILANVLGAFLSATAVAGDAPVWIGSYWSHEIAGITMIEPGQAAVRLRIGNAGLQAKSELYAPDGQINRTTWQTDGAKLTLTWAREGTDGVVGRVASDKPVRIEIAGEIPWRDFRTVYGLTDAGLTAESWGAGHEDTPPPILLPETGDYVFIVAADGGTRLWIDGQKLFDDWTSHASVATLGDVGCVPYLSKPIRLEGDKAHPIKLEYQHSGGPAKMHLRWAHWPVRDEELLSPHLAPPNFYPMLSGIPDGERGKRMMACLLDEKLFWGTYVCPTISRNNRAFKEQHYWRGYIWPPTNYLLYQGLKDYAPDAVRREYARKCLALFRRHGWPAENYTADGEHCSGPYSWGVLLPLVVLEEICDVEPDGRIRLNGTWEETISLRNVPLLGRKYDVEVKPGSTTLLRDGNVVLRAENTVLREAIAQ